MSVADQVGAAAGLVGVLLALVTLFTSAQSSAFQAQQTRSGGADRKVLIRVAMASVSLLTVTIASFLSLRPLASSVWHTRGTPDWQAFFPVFLWVWILLIFLGVWQLVLAYLAGRQWLSHRS